MNPTDQIMWWGYLHQNGTIQVKRWYGDVKDYTTDCEGNEFVQCVVQPFAAQSHGHAAVWIKHEVDKRMTANK